METSRGDDSVETGARLRYGSCDDPVAALAALRAENALTLGAVDALRRRAAACVGDGESALRNVVTGALARPDDDRGDLADDDYSVWLVERRRPSGSSAGTYGSRPTSYASSRAASSRPASTAGAKEEAVRGAEGVTT